MKEYITIIFFYSNNEYSMIGFNTSQKCDIFKDIKKLPAMLEWDMEIQLGECVVSQTGATVWTVGCSYSKQLG